MKYYFLVFFYVFGLIVNAQVETFTLSELDSITEKNSSYERDMMSNGKDSLGINIVERIAIYKGCEKEKGNQLKKECMNRKINEVFKKNFNTVLPKDSKVPSGKIRVFIQFKVDEEGNIVEGQANGPDEHFEKEALRVLKLVPKLTPAYFKEKPIKMPFSLPLIAIVANENNEAINATYPVYRGCKKDANFEETKKCTTDKIIDYIKVSFDYELADKVFPTELTTKFYVEFTINKKGKAEQINVKANHKAIAIDVINLIKRMPKFKAPGTNNEDPVSTKFSALMTVRLL